MNLMTIDMDQIKQITNGASSENQITLPFDLDTDKGQKQAQDYWEHVYNLASKKVESGYNSISDLEDCFRNAVLLAAMLHSQKTNSGVLPVDQNLAESEQKDSIEPSDDGFCNILFQTSNGSTIRKTIPEDKLGEVIALLNEIEEDQ